MDGCAKKSKWSKGIGYLSSHWELYLFVLPALVYIFLYCYYPMYGVQMAFKDFRIAKGIEGSAWVGLKHFDKFLGNPQSGSLIFNTLRLSIYGDIVGFPMAIAFALVLNELPSKRFKAVTQTVSYAPHFISTVVICSMITMFMRKDGGLINVIIGAFDIGPYDFLSKAEWFPSIYVWTNVWQGLGWSTIIYMSALSGINQEIHEAAMIDGASRLKRIWHINLPGILPTICILLILNMGGVMSVGFEKAFLLQNDLNSETSEIISTFTYKMGMQSRQYSYSAAIGLFNSAVNLVLLLTTNAITRKLSDTSFF